ncbi:hypothetical protein AAMO2058_001620300 [Amorphochlora amoebiformis]
MNCFGFCLISRQKHKEKLRERELEEEKKIEMYAKMKEDRLARRKREQEERFRKKQAIRQRMIDDQAEELKKIKAAETKLLMLQANDFQEKRDIELKKQKAKRERMQREIHESRQSQLRAKAKEREEQKVLDTEIALRARERVEEVMELERQERAARMRAQREMGAVWKKQMKEKYDKTVADVRREYNEHLERNKKREAEDVELRKHLAQLRIDMKEKDLNMLPIDKLDSQLSGSRKSRRVCHDGGSTWSGPL